jgi:hypothetical protein
MRTLARHILMIVAVYTLAMFILGFTAGRVRAHDQYHDWMMPDAPNVSCCHNRDCRPVKAESDIDGNWTAIVNGERIAVPRGKVMKIPNPDGRSHWCGQGGLTYCFLPTEGKF